MLLFWTKCFLFNCDLAYRLLLGDNYAILNNLGSRTIFPLIIKLVILGFDINCWMTSYYYTKNYS